MSFLHLSHARAISNHYEMLVQLRESQLIMLSYLEERSMDSFATMQRAHIEQTVAALTSHENMLSTGVYQFQFPEGTVKPVTGDMIDETQKALGPVVGGDQSAMMAEMLNRMCKGHQPALLLRHGDLNRIVTNTHPDLHI